MENNTVKQWREQHLTHTEETEQDQYQYWGLVPPWPAGGNLGSHAGQPACTQPSWLQHNDSSFSPQGTDTTVGLARCHMMLKQNTGAQAVRTLFLAK